MKRKTKKTRIFFNIRVDGNDIVFNWNPKKPSWKELMELEAMVYAAGNIIGDLKEELDLKTKDNGGKP